jgi:hypothetical protein
MSANDHFGFIGILKIGENDFGFCKGPDDHFLKKFPLTGPQVPYRTQTLTV